MENNRSIFLASFLIVIIAVVLFVLTNGEVLEGTDALTGKLQEEMAREGENVSSITYLGMGGKGTECLSWFEVSFQDKDTEYVPMEIREKGKDRYSFRKILKAEEVYEDIAFIKWKEGDSYLINNPSCQKIKTTTKDGSFEEIIEGQIPYIMFCEEDEKYEFLDSSGKKIQ